MRGVDLVAQTDEVVEPGRVASTDLVLVPDDAGVFHVATGGL